MMHGAYNIKLSGYLETFEDLFLGKASPVVL